MRSNVSLSEGQKNLSLLIRGIDEQTVDFNEANTRLRIIDRILTECLGWPKEPGQFRVEEHVDGEYLDYIPWNSTSLGGGGEKSSRIL
jgi:hypothetical protein